MNLAKSKLESLCRELQRHNKAVAVSNHTHLRSIDCASEGSRKSVVINFNDVIAGGESSVPARGGGEKERGLDQVSGDHQRHQCQDAGAPPKEPGPQTREPRVSEHTMYT